MAREPVTQPLGTGVKAIDGLLTCGRGQRLGLFGGSGVGKSTLLGMLTRGTAADVIVLGLVGERGREVRSVPRPRPRRGRPGPRRGGRVHLRQPAAAAHARRLFGHGHRRVLPRSGAARAAADGLRDALCHGAAGGRPRRRRAADHQGLSAVGVRARCRRCSSARAAVRGRGSITAIYTVLVDGDDHNWSRLPTRCDRSSTATSCCRATLAVAHHYPAIDVLQSVSRTMPDVTDAPHREQAARGARLDGRRSATPKIWSAWAHTCRARIRASTRHGRATDAIDAFLCQSSDTLVRAFRRCERPHEGVRWGKLSRFARNRHSTCGAASTTPDGAHWPPRSSSWPPSGADSIRHVTPCAPRATKWRGRCARRTPCRKLGWHRVWIHRLERSRQRLRLPPLAEKEARVAAAMAECAMARQRLEALERLKEKARRAWDDADRMREQRELDAWRPCATSPRFGNRR